MSEIIRQWLTEFGILLSGQKHIFLEEINDGVVIAKILHIHGIINDEQLSWIVPSKAPEIVANNFRYICLWLKLINVTLDQEDFVNLPQPDIMLKLLFETYIILVDTFIYRATKILVSEQRIYGHKMRFKLTPVKEEDKIEDIKKNTSSYMLIEDNPHIIYWHKLQKVELKEYCQKKLQGYKMYVSNNPSNKKLYKPNLSTQYVTTDEDFSEATDKYTDSDYNKLMNDTKRIGKISVFVSSKKDADNFVKEIKHNRNILQFEESFSEKYYRLFVLKMVQKVINEFSVEYNRYVLKKLLQMSYYEKQMLAKMFHVKDQRNGILENQINNEALLTMEQEYVYGEENFMTKQKKWESTNMYLMEVERKRELQERLWAEKANIKTERHVKFCRECVDSIVNVSLRIAEHNEGYKEEASWRLIHDWKGLFVKGKYIFTIFEHVEDLVSYVDDPQLDQDYRMESDRQNAAEERVVDDFISNAFPWDIRKLPEMGEHLKMKQKAMKLMAHIVNRLLLAKYPTPKTNIDEIPKVSQKVCVSNFKNLTAIPMLQKLLSSKGIKVIQISDVINYCMSCYKNEANEDRLDETFASISKETLAFLKMKQEGRMPQLDKPKRKGEKSIGKVLKRISENLMIDEECQTLREEVGLSRSAELGKIAYEVLNIGNALDSKLLSPMLKEYLKPQKDINGWVLINFPEYIYDAVFLEQCLTGNIFLNKCGMFENVPHFEDFRNLELRKLNIIPEIDPNSKFRKSKLVDLQEACKEAESNESCLNKFIFMTKQMDGAEIVDLHKEERENFNYLKQFYLKLCSCYEFTYEELNYFTIKQLAKLIASDPILPTKNSTDILGDTVHDLESNMCPDLKVSNKNVNVTYVEGNIDLPNEIDDEVNDVIEEKANISNKKVKTKLKLTTATKMAKETQIPEKNILKLISKPKLGEPGWELTLSPLPFKIEYMLANLWELLEETYYTDRKQINFWHRVFLNLQLPYVTFASDYITFFMKHLDTKQSHVVKFQKLFNGIDDDIRGDEEIKAELHCRISTFRENLQNLSQIKLQETHEAKASIISDQILAKQTCEFVNMYNETINVELNHFFVTLQIIADYYTAMLSKNLNQELFMFKKIYPDLYEIANTTEIRNIYDFIQNYLIQFGNNNPSSYNACLKKHFDMASDVLDEAMNRSQKILQKFQRPKSTGSKKKKQNEETEHTGVNFTTVEELDDILNEWKCALEGEYSSTYLAIYIIKYFATESFKELINYHVYRLRISMSSVMDRFNKEIENIDAICEIFAHAIESETKIQPRLVLEENNIYVEPNVVYFENPLPGPESPPNEEPDDYIFTIEQLNRLMDIFKTHQSSGYMPEPLFCHLLQDAIVQEAEDGLERMVPLKWCELSPSDIKIVTRKIYGNMDYICWKDFVVYNLYITFPDEKELLDLKQEFMKHDPDFTHTVLRYQYDSVLFWFETSYRGEKEMLRLHKIKNLLAKLFTIKEETINYMKLLISFCKDEEFLKGIAKVIGLFTGKFICWNYSEGRKYVASLEETNSSREDSSICSSNSSDVLKKDTKQYSFTDYCDAILRLENYFFLSSEDFDVEKLINLQLDQSTSDEFTEKLYFLSFYTMITIFTVIFRQPSIQKSTFPCFKYQLEEIYNSCRRPDLNNQVLMHEFLNNPAFLEMFAKNYKFLDINPKTVITKVLGIDEFV